MADPGKVIQGLKCCMDGPMKCEECPYIEDDKTVVPTCVRKLRNDALSLLKAQEPEKVKIKDSDGGTTHWYVCGACKALINIGDKFCHECGKKVGWE